MNWDWAEWERKPRWDRRSPFCIWIVLSGKFRIGQVIREFLSVSVMLSENFVRIGHVIREFLSVSVKLSEFVEWIMHDSRMNFLILHYGAFCTAPKRIL